MAGDYEASVKEFLTSIDIYESKVGRDHGATLSALNNLSYLYLNTGQLDHAERLFVDLVERSEPKYGSQSRSVASVYQNLAGTIGRQGRFAEAIPMHQKAFDIYKSVLPGDHFIQAYPLISIAYAEMQLGNHAVAESTARQAHALLEATVPGTYPAGVARCLIGLALERGGQADKGAELVRESHSILGVNAVFEPYRSACRVPHPES